MLLDSVHSSQALAQGGWQVRDVPHPYRHAVLCYVVRGTRTSQETSAQISLLSEFLVGSWTVSCCSGKAKWWQHALGLVPRTNLVRELGMEHNVTLEAFANTACLVRTHARRSPWRS